MKGNANFIEVVTRKHLTYIMSRLMAQFQKVRKTCIVSHTFFFFFSVNNRKDKGQDNDPRM